MVLTGIKQQQHQTAVQQNTVQATEIGDGARSAEDKRELQKAIEKKCEALLAHKMEELSPERPADWIQGVQKMLRTCRVELFEDHSLPKEAKARRITDEMREILEGAASTTAKKSLTTEPKMRLVLE